MVGDVKRMHGMGLPSSANIGDSFALLLGGSSIIAVSGYLDGWSIHVSEGVTPAIGVVA